MGITLTQYRISIGYFNGCKFVVSGFRIGVGSKTVNLLKTLLYIVVLIILLSGDVEMNPGPNATCKSIKMCHVNIRSLSRSKLLAIQVSLANIYDVITISETHLHQGVGNDLFQIKGYHDIIRRDRGANGGGVAIFIKENI